MTVIKIFATIIVIKSGGNMKIENKTRDMLIIVDVSTLEEENLIATKFDYTLEAIKNKIDAYNLYIVVTNKILNKERKEDLKRIAF